MLEYSYILQYMPGKKNVLAVCLSRLPSNNKAEEDEKPEETIAAVDVDIGGVTDGRIPDDEWLMVTQEDLVLQEVVKYMREGWPTRGVASIDGNMWNRNKVVTVPKCIDPKRFDPLLWETEDVFHCCEIRR
ncbi:hypothetical protein NDU88_008040 [Pleurodeles waltl]|uniref:Uncharacterized protein n=1 Tax=Pleurodeles waltl TaxID=8319 RepID=A0AAV7PP97_PLEWA|nr:hypothetical protein NDU88_008040 [Pleurodeles waltl]